MFNYAWLFVTLLVIGLTFAFMGWFWDPDRSKKHAEAVFNKNLVRSRETYGKISQYYKIGGTIASILGLLGIIISLVLQAS